MSKRPNQFHFSSSLTLVPISFAASFVRSFVQCISIWQEIVWLCRTGFLLSSTKHNTLRSTQPAYLHSLLNYLTPTHSLCSANTNLLSIPRVLTTFASRGFSVAAPAVWNSLPSGIRDSSSTHTFHRLLKTHCFQQAFGSPSDSPKCLRFSHWLTLCTTSRPLGSAAPWNFYTL